MISTQRLIMLLIGINLIIGMAHNAYHNPTAFSSEDEQISVERQLMNQYEEDMKDDGTLYRKILNNQIVESVVNAFSWGGKVAGLLIDGLNPFGITPSQFDTPVEKTVASLILLTRSLIMGIAGIELLLVFINRKAN